MDEETIFAAALELTDLAEREAYLDRACGGDAALKNRLARLIAAHDATRGILDHLETTGKHVASGSSSDGIDEGTVIAGRYRLVRQVGEGGMGTVWEAEQTEPVRRKVVVKLIKAGMDTRRVLARFEAERQALALMDHPNIAKILDGGATPDGRPYFVMEFVEGVTLTRYCDDACLDIAERLELFLPVSQAVQHAHTKGVIHRDLKPGNILVAVVDGRPMPKVIDFGLAKATTEPLTEHGNLTTDGLLLGTPLYMSPEQALSGNLDIDARTDVYALGVILYELLTGTTPLERRRLREAAWDEMLRLIKEEDPPRPSVRLVESDSLPSIAAQRRLDPGRLTRKVRGELDWIALKCLEKDRERRYETVSELGRDVERYLADESVEACPPSVRYRFGKFVRRHRGAVAAATVAVLSLVGGIVGMSWGLYRAEIARKAEALRAEGEAKANREAQARLRQVEKGIDLLESVFKTLDPVFEEREGKPLRVILGERLVEASSQIDEGAIADRPLVDSLQDRLGTSLLNLGLASKAMPIFEKIQAERAARLGPDDPETLMSLNILASCYQTVGQRERALELFRKTLELRRARLGPDHPDTLTSLHNLALCTEQVGDYPRSIALYEEALAGRRARLGPEDTLTIETMNGLANALKSNGNLDRAIPILEEALRLRRKNVGPDHLTMLNTMSNLAVSYRTAGRVAESIALLEDALKFTREKVGPDHPDTLTLMNNLARAYLADGQKQRARDLFEETLKGRRSRLSPDHPNTLTTLSNLGMTYKALGQPDKALALVEEALQIRRRKLPPAHPELLVSLHNVASVNRDLGRLDVAIPLLREAATRVKEKDFQIFGVDQFLGDLINALEMANQFPEAETWRRAWLGYIKKKSGEGSREAADSTSSLGENLLRQSRWVDAETVLREAETLFAKKAAGSPAHSLALWRLGRALLGQSHYAEAEKSLLRSDQGLRSGGDGDANLAGPRSDVGESLIRLYESWGKSDLAAEWRARLTRVPMPPSGRK